jgi:hypothetical protein
MASHNGPGRRHGAIADEVGVDMAEPLAEHATAHVELERLVPGKQSRERSRNFEVHPKETQGGEWYGGWNTQN